MSVGARASHRRAGLVSRLIADFPGRWGEPAVAAAQSYERQGFEPDSWPSFIDAIDAAMLDVEKSVNATRRHSRIVPRR
jgi:hypothetical protein